MINSVPKYYLGSLSAIMLVLCACQPRVTVEAPDKPVQIDLNIKIQHELKVKIEKDVENLINKNPDLF